MSRTGYHRIGLRPRLQALAMWLVVHRELRRLNRADRTAIRLQATRLDLVLDARDVDLWTRQIYAPDTDIVAEAER
jgi:hypothetical protein